MYTHIYTRISTRMRNAMQSLFWGIFGYTNPLTVQLQDNYIYVTVSRNRRGGRFSL